MALLVKYPGTWPRTSIILDIRRIRFFAWPKGLSNVELETDEKEKSWQD